ncbi:MAG: type II toxin-antitoxin system RelE/ParE family toxin [Nitrospirae bacterium]|nr:type II toxin-antitoxin system RelE/ParE family toxin [Nitrospirota bacterium]
MELLYKTPFKKFVKKQARPFQLVIEDEVDLIKANPSIGISKKQDLAGMNVHKFTFHKQEYLIAYKQTGRVLVFYMIDTHENFYRELKRYIKAEE